MAMDRDALLTTENMQKMREDEYIEGYAAGFEDGWKKAIDNFAQLVTGFRELVPHYQQGDRAHVLRRRSPHLNRQ